MITGDSDRLKSWCNSKKNSENVRKVGKSYLKANGVLVELRDAIVTIENDGAELGFNDLRDYFQLVPGEIPDRPTPAASLA